MSRCPRLVLWRASATGFLRSAPRGREMSVLQILPPGPHDCLDTDRLCGLSVDDATPLSYWWHPMWGEVGKAESHPRQLLPESAEKSK